MSEFSDGLIMGMTMEDDTIKDIGQIKADLIAEMRRSGMLLPRYDWQNKDFNDTLEAITVDWFARHPETKRSGGEFDRKYPKKAAGFDLLEKMSNMGRITPDEYIALYGEIFNF